MNVSKRHVEITVTSYVLLHGFITKFRFRPNVCWECLDNVGVPGHAQVRPINKAYNTKLILLFVTEKNKTLPICEKMPIFH